MKLAKLIKSTDILAWEGHLNKTITGITYDSRQVTTGSLFVAIAGFNTDGHQYINDAISRGAVAVVIEGEKYKSSEYTWIQVQQSRTALAELSSTFYGNPSSLLNLIGVTGTNGKTTVTNLITAILEDAGNTAGLVGTIHNRIGKELIPVHHTTPEAPDLQELFVKFLNKGANYAVMEVSSHALDLERVRGAEFDVAVFTNLTQDHLDFHGNMESYLRAKGKLFSTLSTKGKKQRRKFAILNKDDKYYHSLEEMISVPIITYGIKNYADIKAENVRVLPQGVEYDLHYTDQVIPVRLKLTGIFNVYNSLAAIAVGLVEGIPINQIIKSLEKIPGIPGRFEKVEAGQDFTVIVDYSHTPDSLENCLKTTREFIKDRIITVFGCGGDRDKKKRPVMGEIAGKFSDMCVVTSDNPRSENPLEIINDIVPGVNRVMRPRQYVTIEDRRKAIRFAIRKAKPGDAVIIAGKGHEDYQIIGDKVIHFDDKEVAREMLSFLIQRQQAK